MLDEVSDRDRFYFKPDNEVSSDLPGSAPPFETDSDRADEAIAQDESHGPLEGAAVLPAVPHDDADSRPTSMDNGDLGGM